MKTIWKYQLKPSRQGIELPEGYKILTVQIQNDIPCLWVLIDPEVTKKELVEIEVFGTGHDIFHIDGKTERKYIDTFQLHHGGALIFHVFQRIS